jgi:hypothetical protein
LNEKGGTTMIGFYPYRVHMTKEIEGNAAVHIPMVYEDVAPPRWEYRVLSIQPAEKALPDEETLNALGRDGWLMTGLLDERTSGRGTFVHYYFVRQAMQ